MTAKNEAAIVLCGGRSRRMGRDKGSLPFGAETLLERTVRTVGEVVDEVLVVAREDQEVAGGYRVVRDRAEGLGPLAGLTEGLAAMDGERAFLTSCDVPFLRPEYVRRMLELSQGYELAVPNVDGHFMTTSAVYSRVVLPLARELVDQGRLRPYFLLARARARLVTEDELYDVDPDLESFRNCNTLEDYEAALRDAGL